MIDSSEFIPVYQPSLLGNEKNMFWIVLKVAGYHQKVIT